MSETTLTGPSPIAAFTVLIRLFLTATLTRARIAILSVLAVFVAVITAVGGSGSDPAQTSADVLDGLGLAIVIPVITLVVANATLGELREEQTLVYLWLRPIPAWTIAAAATIATVGVTLPFAVGAMGVGAVLSGEGDLVSVSILAAVLAVIGYSGIFVPVGLAVRRSFLTGLGYALIWESLISLLGSGLARFSIRSWAASIIATGADVDLPTDGRSSVGSILVPIAVLVAGIGVTVWLLGHREID
ncbi:MAG: hypothetical protein OEU32_16160 [Acidimicrobiia bacterium]|nr:hypothetical protein [Acidimicrobiia bacterium]